MLTYSVVVVAIEYIIYTGDLPIMASIKDKVKALEEEINKSDGECRSKPRAWCTKTLVIIAVLAPLINFVLLYFIQPRFVTVVKDGVAERSTKKLMVWTGIAWVIEVGLLMAYAYYAGGGSMSCFYSWS